MIPLHQALTPDQQTYLLALIEWHRASDLAADCAANSSDPEDELSAGWALYHSFVALAKAGEPLSRDERCSIQKALAEATGQAEPITWAHAAA